MYEFFFCRIYELFHERPRGGVPATLEEVRKQLPAHRPDFNLLFNTSRDYQSKNFKESTDSKPLELNPEYSNRNGLPDIENRMTFTWIGQSCAFIQLAGLNILTDPCFGEHLVHPSLGPKRISPAPCHLSELPKIDLVLVSHDHPDHLELEAAEEIGNSALWIVPKGVGKHLERVGISNFREMTWWEKKPLIEVPLQTAQLDNAIATQATDNGLTKEETDIWEIACTPAMHWSGRRIFDSNSTLWCSFLVLKNNKPVFFHAGDTGYSYPLFKSIEKIYGPGCKVAMVPCGAYTPRWHLRSQHLNPQEAIQVMKDLEAKKMIGVHWGTFVLSEEHFCEPRDLLNKLAKEEGKSNDIVAPEFGKTLVYNLED